MTNRKHTHGEAFCLMTYASEDGRIREILWNSRDGVTPFMIRARDGKTPLRHIDWRNDRYAPDHRPGMGERVFVSITLERCIEHKREMFDRYHKDPGFAQYLDGRSREQFAREEGQVMYEEHPDAPDIKVVDAGFLAWLDSHPPEKR